MNGKEFLLAAFLPKKLIFIDGATVDASRVLIIKGHFRGRNDENVT